MYSVGQMIASYRKKKKMSQPELADRLASDGIRVSYKTISGWEKNTSEPSVTTFLHLCRILEIPDTQEEFFGSNPLNPLASLNDAGKEKVFDYVHLLVCSGEYKKEYAEVLSFPVRTLRLYRPMVSAGTGNFLDSNEFDLMEVGDEVPATADFGVQLSGDSMEPKYCDRQIVYVHRQEVLANGEIGIFLYDGNAFCKRLQKDESGLYLISLNKKYAAIPVRAESDLTVFGKVVG